MNHIYMNGEWVEDGPALAFNDRLRLGDGVFDTMLVIVEEDRTRLIHAERHFMRLIHGLELMEIAPIPSAHTLIDTAKQIFEKNAPAPGRYTLNTLVTRGESQRGLMPPSEIQPTIIMRAAPVADEFPPIEAITSRRTFRNEGSPLSQIKSLSYGDNILALIEARHKGANEALLFNNAGNLACATAGNIFMILDGIFYTPPLSDGVLDGITRQIFLEKHQVIVSSLSMGDLHKAEGLYITSSIKGCRPVQTLNGKTLPPPTIKIPQDFHIT